MAKKNTNKETIFECVNRAPINLYLSRSATIAAGYLGVNEGDTLKCKLLKTRELHGSMGKTMGDLAYDVKLLDGVGKGNYSILYSNQFKIK